MADISPQDRGTQAFPPAIAKAVIEVMAALGSLEKGRERNDAGAKYSYASIDDFIQHVRGACIAAGLFIIPSEDGEAKLVDMVDSKGKPLVVWWTRFAFTLIHKDGESYGPIFKTVMVRAGGAQAAGAAQSYAIKQLMRGLFQIPTGEGDDPDKDNVELRGRGDAETDLQVSAGKIRRAMLTAPDMDELGRIWSDNAMTLDLIKARTNEGYEHLLGEYRRMKERLENA